MPSIKSYFIKINNRKLTNPFNRILPFVITYHPAVKNLTKNAGKMESHENIAFAESLR